MVGEKICPNIQFFINALLARLTRLAARHRLAHELERALLGDKAKCAQVLNGLLSRRVLLAGNDTTLVLHQVFLRQTARGVLRSSMENLGFGSNSRNVCHGSSCRRDYVHRRNLN